MTSYSLIATLELRYNGINDKITPSDTNTAILDNPGTVIPQCSAEAGVNKISYNFASPLSIKGVTCTQVNSFIVDDIKITETERLG